MAEQPNISQILAALGNTAENAQSYMVTELIGSTYSRPTPDWHTNPSSSTTSTAARSPQFSSVIFNRNPIDWAGRLCTTTT